MSSRIAVFFRTHVWDAYVARQAALLSSLSHAGHFYILADETRTILPVQGFHKYSHRDADFEPLGLEPYFNTNLLWYNGDYPLYLVATRFPHYDYYVMIEFDVLTNVDLVGMMQQAASDGIDAVAYDVHPVEPAWPWLESCKGIYDQPLRGLIPVLGVSKFAIEYLFEKRRRLTRLFRAGTIDRMPYCEAFIPTELTQSGLFTVADLSHFGRTEQFNFWPPILDTSARLGPAPEFAHPVLNEERFIPNRLRHEANPASYLDPASRLRHDLSRCNPAAVAPFLLDAMHRLNDPGAADDLQRLLPTLAAQWSAR